MLAAVVRGSGSSNWRGLRDPLKALSGKPHVQNQLDSLINAQCLLGVLDIPSHVAFVQGRSVSKPSDQLPSLQKARHFPAQIAISKFDWWVGGGR